MTRFTSAIDAAFWRTTLYSLILLALPSSIHPAFGFPGPIAFEELEAKLGRKVTTDLIAKILRDGVSENRFLAICAALDLGTDAKPLLPLLVAALDDNDWRIRCNATHLIGDIGASAAGGVPGIVRLLADKNEILANNAAFALGSIGPKASAAVPALLAVARGDGPGGAAPWVAIEALGKIGPEAKSAVPLLIAVLKDGNNPTDLRKSAALSLGTVVSAADSDVVSALASAARLNHGLDQVGIDDSESCEESGIRIAAALSLWRVAREPRVISWLITTTQKENNGEHVRKAAVEALSEIGPNARTAVPELIRLADETPRGTRTSECGVQAFTALARIGPAAKAAIPVLVRHLDLEHGEGMSAAAIDALGDIGPAAATAIPSILQAMAMAKEFELENLPRLRLSAAVAIRKIGGDTLPTIPVLIEILSIQETPCFWSRFVGVRQAAGIRRDAANALGELGPSAVESVAALKALLKDDFITVREAAERALEKIQMQND